MKYIAIIMLTFLVFQARSQSLDTLDSKYLVALIYLKTNEKAKSAIKRSFRYLIKKREKCINFNVSNQVDYLGIWYFYGQLKQNNYGIPEEFIENSSLYDEKYKFDSYQNNSLGKLINKPDTRLYLTFSKPVKNHLVAEILDKEVSKSKKYKLGASVQFLFKFNKDGLIEDVIYSGGVYD